MSPEMVSVHWFVAELLGALGLPIILGNWALVVQMRRDGKFRSAIPLLGGLVGGVAVAFVPKPWVPAFSWVPLLLDWGTGWLLLSRLVFQVRRARQS